MRDLVIGIDSSTTASKAVVWNAEGVAVAQARATYETSHPQPSWGEQNAEDWWVATRRALARAVQSVDSSRIAAICVTHQRETFVCLDQNAQPLRPAMLWMDGRAVKEVEQHGTARVHELTGKPANLTPAWYKLLWLRTNEPETLQRATKIVDVQGFLNHRLTGEWVTSWGSADPLGVVDMRTFDYDDGLLAEAGLNRDQFCRLVAPGDVVALLADDIADELNLPRGIPVVAGLGDGQSAQLGTGAIVPGRGYINLGTGVVAGTYSDQYSFSKAYRVLSAAVPGGYTFETFIGGGTYNLQWFVDKFAGIDPRALGLELSPEQVLETAAATLPPGADGLMVLPYWTGALTPFWDHYARGAMIGLTGAHGKSHVYRALLESIAFEQRFLTEGAESALSTPVKEIIALGGGSRSRVWCQIVADVMQRAVDVVAEPESTCLGAGMLAAVQAGMHPDIHAAARSMSSTGAHFEPDPKRVQIYDELFNVYRGIYPALRGIFPGLAEIGEKAKHA